jgi:hypothetical protein
MGSSLYRYVAVIPPTWRVSFMPVKTVDERGGGPPPFREDVIAPVLDSYAFAKDWLVAGVGGEAVCLVTDQLTNRGVTSYAAALKVAGNAKTHSCGEDAKTAATGVTGYKPGMMAKQYAKKKPDAVGL